MWFFISRMTMTMTRRWRWWWWRRRSDVNLKRSDEDKAWERGAVVVSESVFGSSDHFAPEQIWSTGKRNRGTFLLVPPIQNINKIQTFFGSTWFRCSRVSDLDVWRGIQDTMRTNISFCKLVIPEEIKSSLTHSLIHSIVFYKVDSTQVERSTLSLFLLRTQKLQIANIQKSSII